MSLIFIHVNVKSHGVMTNMLDCDIIVSDFEHQTGCYIHFSTNCCGGLTHLTIMDSSHHYYYRDFAAREADQYQGYPNSTRLLTFSM